MAGQTSSFAAGGDPPPSHLLALGGAGFTSPEAQPIDDLALDSSA